MIRTFKSEGDCVNYEDLLIEADRAGLIVKEKPLLLSDGRIKGRKIAIRKDIPTLRKKADVLAEELGHYYTTTGRIVRAAICFQPEAGTRRAAVGVQPPDRAFRNHPGYRQNCRNLHELAECLEVSEDFLKEALECYREKYGCYTELDGYLIMFEPCLAVVEKI